MEDTLIQAKSIVPNNIYKYTNLSTVLIVVGKYDDAMIYIDKALAINPKDTYAEFNKTLDYYMLGKLADANVRYHNLRGTNTVTYEDKIIFANYKLGNADYVGASTLIDEVLKVDPTNEMALATKVKLYSEMHKAGKTVTDKTFDYTTPAVVDAAMNKLNKYWFLKNYR